MSKIHQAKRRAEQEGRSAGIVPSGARERVQGAIASRESSLSSAIHDLALPKNENRPTGPAVNALSDLIEKTTVPDSRLVALSSGTCDGLRDKLCRTRADARAGGSALKAIFFTSLGVGDGKSLTTANVSISISKEAGE